MPAFGVLRWHEQRAEAEAAARAATSGSAFGDLNDLFSVPAEATCIECGCTESQACEGGCSWAVLEASIGYGVCSRCVASNAWQLLPLMRWRLIDDYPLPATTAVIGMRKLDEPDWMLLSGLWICGKNGWQEETCGVPLPIAEGWEYRWLDEVELISLLPPGVPAAAVEQSA